TDEWLGEEVPSDDEADLARRCGHQEEPIDITDVIADEKHRSARRQVFETGHADAVNQPGEQPCDPVRHCGLPPRFSMGTRQPESTPASQTRQVGQIGASPSVRNQQIPLARMKTESYEPHLLSQS